MTQAHQLPRIPAAVALLLERDLITSEQSPAWTSALTNWFNTAPDDAQDAGIDMLVDRIGDALHVNPAHASEDTTIDAIHDALVHVFKEDV